MKTQAQNRNVRRGEAGNVLFLILIAVALFAALSYAVTQSTRSGGGDANKEKSLVNSAVITQYPASLKTAITRMTLTNGVDMLDLNFTKPVDFDDLLAPDASGVTAATNQKNAVFYATGGGATYSDGPAEVSSTGAAQGWIFNAQNEVVNIGTTATTGVTAGTADIIAFLPNTRKAVCQRVHEQLGLEFEEADLADAFPIISGLNVTQNKDYVAANFNVPKSTNPSGGRITSSVLDGQPQGCVRTAADTYHYYHVLVER